MYAISIIDSSGVEVGRFDYIDDSTGLISVGGGEADHIPIPDLLAEQAYLYVSEGQMVLEDAAGNGEVIVDDYPLEGPRYISGESFVSVGPYTLQVLSASAPGAPPPPGDTLPPPPDNGHSAAQGAVSGDLEGGGDDSYESAESQGHYYQSGAAQVAMDLAYAPGGPAVNKGPLKMVALSGLMAGKEYLLEQGKEYDVGRDEDEALEVPLDDPTVSRRHARLRVSDGGVMVLDLRSSNGTFINGEPVKRELATDGDRVRFAEVGFKLSPVMPDGLEEEKKRKLPSPRKMIFIVAGVVGVVGLLVLGYALKRRADKGKGKVKQVAKQETLGEKQRRKFRKAMDRGQKSLDKQKWTVAIAAFEEALEDYPSKSAKERAEGLLEKARKEKKAMGIIGNANKAFDATGGDLAGYKKALGLYEKVPMSSYYSVEAKDKIEKISLRLAKLYLTQALSYAKLRRTKNRVKAQKFFCNYFNVLGNVGRTMVNESKYRDQLKDLEKKIARKSRYIKRKKIDYEPCKAPRFLKKPIQVAGTRKLDAAQEIRDKYKNENLVGVLMLYYKGETDGAIKRLSKIKNKRGMRKKVVLLSEIHQRLAVIKGKLAEGDGALQTTDIEKADESYTDAFKAEEKLLPEKLVSFTRREASRRLAGKYQKLGEAQYKLGRYKQAYEFWSRGKKYDPSDTKILNGLVKLEKEALQLLQQAQASPKDKAKNLYEMIKAITEDSSPIHKKAVKALGGQ